MSSHDLVVKQVWLLVIGEPKEGTALHFACSRELGNAALAAGARFWDAACVAASCMFLAFFQALLACGDFDLSVPKVRERDGSTARGLSLRFYAGKPAEIHSQV